VGAAAVLSALVLLLALPAGASAQKTATRISGLSKQLSRLSKLVSELEARDARLTNMQVSLGVAGPGGPAGLGGPAGEQGLRGPQGSPGSLGPASGDLTGTYPNPLIAPDAVDSASIADGSILSSDLAPDSILTPALADNAVTSQKIADGAVSESDIGNGEVTSQKIHDGTILNEDIANNAIDSTKIFENSVGSAKIQNGAIAANKIAGNSITTFQIANPGISAFDLAPGIAHASALGQTSASSEGEVASGIAVATATCPPGSQMLSGGAEIVPQGNKNPTVTILYSGPVSENTWEVKAQNTNSEAGFKLNSVVRCLL
jgi:hypothetical protein